MRVIVFEANPKHIKVSLFMTNANNGLLCFDHEEWEEFEAMFEDRGGEVLYQKGVNMQHLEDLEDAERL